MPTVTIPRIVIAAPSSGAGKTTITAGLIGALRRRGLRVQPFKCGPDFIDPSHLARAAGRPARNLDTWMCEPDTVQQLFAHACRDADIAIIEGVMGLFDGRSGEGEAGSTAQIAKLLGAPVVLVQDIAKVARSAAAVTLGFQQFDPDLHLAGVILNRSGSQRHCEIIAPEVTRVTGLPVLGAIPRSEAMQMPERHLGLVPDAEVSLSNQQLDIIVDLLEQNCDIDAILALAQTTGPLVVPEGGPFSSELAAKTVRIAVAQDAAFSFYYQDNLDLLEHCGAELVPFSPLTDPALPAGTQGLYLGGGFPEVYAGQLAANRALKRELIEIIDDGLPTLAECGGFIYLTESLTDLNGQSHSMCGILPGIVHMRNRPTLAYLTVKPFKDTLLLPKGETVRAHEFHYSVRATLIAFAAAAFAIKERPGEVEGHAERNLLASYLHIHFAARPDLAPRFVAACRDWVPA
ncbi:MAG: cobyrinate a,c-diamide synthase [Dehalococcoidia bacterium]|nr:cobyrinate a,c-diamide synthase [Dehalococcoidia bacterium]